MSGDWRFLTAFYFRVSVGDGRNQADSSFQEVRGLTQAIATEDVVEGGENRFVWKLPKAATQQNLTLKRGVAPSGSQLLRWCKKILEDGNGRIQTNDVTVQLLNREGDPVKSWVFARAYPVKWQIEQLDAKKNEVAIETIELAYHECSRIWV